jgi:hypothetical protein
MPDDQRAVLAFLADPASYGLPPGTRIERIDTHCAAVFLAGARAYKLKRAVRFPYLDFSTPALRERFCRAELAINRRTAPDLYLGVRALTREPDGRLAFDGRGETVDWVLEMRRFDQDALFDRMAEAGRLTPALMRDLADAIRRFHDAAEPMPGFGGRKGFAHVLAGNLAELDRAAADGTLDAAAVQVVARESEAALAGLGALLDRRREAGLVRRCHGDLHLRNICLIDGRPTLFDAIEFSEELAAIDPLYDLAFLLMDLEHRRLRPLGNLVLNRYLDRTVESVPATNALAALPLFMATRAAIRAHVSATAARMQPDEAEAARARAEARLYLDLASRLLKPVPPRLIAVGGLSGTGKSTLAYALAPALGAAPGARVLRSDVTRKRIMGVAPETRLPPEGYSAEVTARVYETIRTEAAAALAAGAAVVADAVFGRPEERHAIEAVARAAGLPFDGLWLEAPPATLAARVESRRADASDADAAVVRRQLEQPTGAITWRRIDASGDASQTEAAARKALGLAKRG